MRALLTLVLLALPPSAWAQRSELAFLAGYTTQSDLDHRAPSIEELAIDDAFTWGLQAGHFFDAHVGVEAAWTRQETAVALAQAGGERVDLFDVNVDQVVASVAYRFGGEEARLRPFLFAGAGATFLGAAGLDGEVKFAWTAGAGVKWSLSRRVGARLQARYAPTYLNDADSEFCDPFGFCQAWLHPLQLTAGVAVAF